MSVTTAKPIDPKREAAYRALTDRWSKFSLAAQQALHELWEVECEIEQLDHSDPGRSGLPAAMREHLARINEVNVDALVSDLMMSEREDATFLEDGNTPTPEPGFIDDLETPVLSDHLKNQRDLHATLNGTIEAFRERK